MAHSSSGRQGLNTALNDARRHIKGLRRKLEVMVIKLSKEVWERRINEAGSGRYEFVRWAVDGEFLSKHKVVVRCVIDEFEWSAKVSSLVSVGYGCPQCAGKRKWTAEERIEQISELENIEFVSWVDGYSNCYSKANVKCTIDGFSWSASVSNLINQGYGCPRCAGNRRFTEEERIEQINSLKNIEFVSWVDCYKGSYSKANLKCGIDGFGWSARVHYLVNQGSGCPRCAKTGFDQTKDGSLYALRSECGKYVKVGISNDPKRRHNELQKRTPFKFNIVEQISGDGAKIAELEKHFHSNYERAGFARFDGCTEWLICTPQLLEELRELEDVK